MQDVSIHYENYAPIYIQSADKVFITLKGINRISDGSGYTLSEQDSNVDGAVFSKADLTINGDGNLEIMANCKHAIVSKDDLVITGGNFTITAQTDGLQAETLLRIDGGDFHITTGGGSVNSSTQSGGEERPGWGNWGGQKQTAEADTASAKALKAGSKLSVYGGNFIIDSSDDSLHCNEDIAIYQGEFTLSSGDDGIHADNKLYIENGNIEIKKSYEGL